MTLSKSSAVVASSALAAIVFAVGCGKPDQSSKQRMRVNHNLQHVDGAGVKNRQNKKNGTSTDAASATATADTTAKAGIATLLSQETQLQALPQITVEQLADGDYQLKSITTYLVYRNTETLSAMNENDVVISDAGVSWTSKQNQSFGKMTLDSDLPRQIDIASSFKKDLGWTADRSHASNFMLTDAYGVTTKGQLNDSWSAGLDQKVSMFKILATAPDKTGLYSAKDDDGKTVTLKLYKSQDGKLLRVFMSIVEKQPDATATTAATKTSAEELYRNVYLDYSITAPAAQ